MLKLALAVVAVLPVGCLLPPSYVVTDVHGDTQTKCALDGRGQITADCHDESTDGSEEVVYGAAPQEPDPNPDDRVAPGGLAWLAPRAAPHPPRAAELSRALASADVRAHLAQCRDAYAFALDRFTAQVTIAPTGMISQVAPLGVDDRFGACAARAIHAAHVAPFAGNAVVLEQELTL